MSEETTTEKTEKKTKKNGEAETAQGPLFGHVVGHIKDNTPHLALSALVFPDFDGRAGEKPLPAEFVESIASEGIREPVLVAPIKGTEKFIIVAGRRRVRAAKEAKLKEVPVRYVEIPASMSQADVDALLAGITLTENLQRENPNDWDVAMSCKKLLDCGFTQEAIATKAHKGVPWVSQHLGLLKLDPRVQNLCRANANTDAMFSKARQLLRVSDAEAQFAIARDAFSRENNWTSVDVQHAVEKQKAKEEAAVERAVQKAKATRKRAAKGEEAAADDGEDEASPYASAKVEVGVKAVRELLDTYDRKLRSAREREAEDVKVQYLRGVLDGLKLVTGQKALPKSLTDDE